MNRPSYCDFKGINSVEILEESAWLVHQSLLDTAFAHETKLVRRYFELCSFHTRSTVYDVFLAVAVGDIFRACGWV